MWKLEIKFNHFNLLAVWTLNQATRPSQTLSNRPTFAILNSIFWKNYSLSLLSIPVSFLSHCCYDVVFIKVNSASAVILLLCDDTDLYFCAFTTHFNTQGNLTSC